MKKHLSPNFISTLIVVLFALFLIAGQLTSSDFTLGIYTCPNANHYQTQHWQSYDSLNLNVVWNARSTWLASDTAGTSTVEEYFQKLAQFGMKTILTSADWHATEPGYSDTIPYWVEYYAHGQYNQLQVDWDYSYASGHLNDDGESYYYFDHTSGTEIVYYLGANALKCAKDACPGSGNVKFADGCRDLESEIKFGVSEYLLYEPLLDFSGKFGYETDGRIFVTRVRAAINNSGSLNSTDTVMVYQMSWSDTCWVWNPDSLRMEQGTSDWIHNELFLTKADFPLDQTYYQFYIEDTVNNDYGRLAYKFSTTNKCDLYVDWVEYMDKEQGYPLFWDAVTCRATLELISQQVDSMHLSAEALAESLLYKRYQFDKSNRSCFQAHCIIKDYLLNRESQTLHPLITSR